MSSPIGTSRTSSKIPCSNPLSHQYPGFPWSHPHNRSPYSVPSCSAARPYLPCLCSVLLPRAHQNSADVFIVLKHFSQCSCNSFRLQLRSIMSWQGRHFWCGKLFCDTKLTHKRCPKIRFDASYHLSSSSRRFLHGNPIWVRRAAKSHLPLTRHAIQTKKYSEHY